MSWQYLILGTLTRRFARDLSLEGGRSETGE